MLNVLRTAFLWIVLACLPGGASGNVATKIGWYPFGRPSTWTLGIGFIDTVTEDAAGRMSLPAGRGHAPARGGIAERRLNIVPMKNRRRIQNRIA